MFMFPFKTSNLVAWFLPVILFVAFTLHFQCEMSHRNCCITGCSNGGRRLKIWSSKICLIHNSNYGKFKCTCEPPFRLFTFPPKDDDRKKWIKAVNRKDTNNPNKIWTPNTDSRVCSVHFVDGYPSTDNPHPTLSLGYETRMLTTPRKPPKNRYVPMNASEAPTEKKAKREVSFQHDVTTDLDSTSDLDSATDLDSTTEPDLATAKSSLPSDSVCHHSVSLDHAYGDIFQSCDSCTSKDAQIRNLKLQIQKITEELNHVKGLYQRKVKKPFGVENIVSDGKMKFYTGIPSKAAFFAIFDSIKSSLPKVKYWRGCRTLCNPLRYKVVKKPGPERQLSHKDEFLMTCMKIRLGLLNEDLADRFGISKQSVSNIFTTWIKLLDKFIGSLVFNPPKEVLRENLPPSFQNPTYSSVRHIIDCTEVFLETPHNLSVRANTWSDYKHHNTAKYLVSITPSGMINFVSKGWGGRTSDKHITTHSGFLDLIEPYDKVLADRGFTITEDLILLQAELLIPPGR